MAWATLAAVTLAALLLMAAPARGQAIATAERTFTLSAWAGGAGTWTGIEGGHNASLTIGGDLGLPTWGPLRTELEFRAAYPVMSGTIVGEESGLIGAKFHWLPNSDFHPYAEVLGGLGQMNYQGAGIIVGNLIYEKSSSTVYGLAAGIDSDLTRHYSVKVDFQIQDWKTPVTTSGSAYPVVLTIGAVYRFHVDRYPVQLHKRPESNPGPIAVSAPTPEAAPATPPSAPAPASTTPDPSIAPRR